MTSICLRALGPDFSHLHARIQERFGFEMNVIHRTRGLLFGYRGAFDVEWVDGPDGPPDTVRPRREERREKIANENRAQDG